MQASKKSRSVLVAQQRKVFPGDIKCDIVIFEHLLYDEGLFLIPSLLPTNSFCVEVVCFHSKCEKNIFIKSKQLYPYLRKISEEAGATRVIAPGNRFTMDQITNYVMDRITFRTGSTAENMEIKLLSLANDPLEKYYVTSPAADLETDWSSVSELVRLRRPKANTSSTFTVTPEDRDHSVGDDDEAARGSQTARQSPESKHIPSRAKSSRHLASGLDEIAIAASMKAPSKAPSRKDSVGNISAGESPPPVQARRPSVSAVPIKRSQSSSLLKELTTAEGERGGSSQYQYQYQYTTSELGGVGGVGGLSPKLSPSKSFSRSRSRDALDSLTESLDMPYTSPSSSHKSMAGDRGRDVSGSGGAGAGSGMKSMKSASSTTSLDLLDALDQVVAATSPMSPLSSHR